jgi:hypothetical protein
MEEGYIARMEKLWLGRTEEGDHLGHTALNGRIEVSRLGFGITGLNEYERPDESSGLMKEYLLTC